MPNFLKSNFKKFTAVIVLTLLTFLTLQTNFLQVFLINDSLAAAGYQYAFPVDVCKTGVKNVEDVFGSKMDGKNVPYSRIKISKLNTNVYAITSGVVTKVEKIAGKASFWLSGSDGYNYYYAGLSEVTVTEGAVKVGTLLGRAEKGYIYFAVMKGGYQTELSSDTTKDKSYYRSNSYRTERGIQTQVYNKEGVELFNPTSIFNNDNVIRQCSEVPNPTVILAGSGVSPSSANSVTLKSTITDPADKSVTVEFRIRKQGDEKNETLQISDIHKKTWAPAKWKKSGSTLEYTFKNLEPGMYEWSARGMNADGVYSQGVAFGLETPKQVKVSHNVALAQPAITQVVSDGFAPVQTVQVGDITESGNEIVYTDIFSDPLKVGSDDKGDCCYAVIPATNTIKITPNTGKYSFYIVAEIPRGFTGDRQITIYNKTTVDKEVVYHTGDNTITYYRAGQSGYTRNQFVYWIDSSKYPWNLKEHNVSLKIKNPENVSALNPEFNNADSTFFVKEVLVTRPATTTPPTTTPPITTPTTNPPTTTYPTTVSSTVPVTTTPPPVITTSCPMALDRSKLSVYEAPGTKDPCCNSGTPVSGCDRKAYCQNIEWVKGAEGRDLAQRIGALGQSDGIAGDRTKVDNLIRAEIAKQFDDLTPSVRATAQKIILSYAYLESNNYYKFFDGSGAPRYYCDSSAEGCCLDYFSLTNWQFATKEQRAAASYDIKYATYKAVKEFRNAYLYKGRPTTLDGWKSVANRVFGSEFWSKTWGYSPNHAAYLTQGLYANEVAYSCEKPNNAPNINILTVDPAKDIVPATSGSDVTLKAVAIDPDGDQTQIKFRLYKFDTLGQTVEQYCSTMQEQGFDAFQGSGVTHQATFRNLSPGTYRWSAISNDEHGKKSEGPSYFCYSSNNPELKIGLPGFATPQTFKVNSTLGTVNTRPYISMPSMVATPVSGGTKVSLTANGFDDDTADTVQLYYRVREKVLNSCVLPFSDSGWTALKASGLPHPVDVSGLKPGTTYEWSVKAQDQDGLESKYTTDPYPGLSFCGVSGWYPAKEFTTLPDTTTVTTTGPSPSCTFLSPSYTVAPGGSVNLGYSTANANSAQVCSAGGTCRTTSIGTNQNFVATPTASTVYTMTVMNLAGKTANCTTSVSVTTSTAPSTTSATTVTSPPPACTFAAPSYSVPSGGSVNLVYSTTNANTAQICSAGGTCRSATVGTSKTFSATPTASTIYTMTVTNTAGRTASCTTSVSVIGTPAPAPACIFNPSSYIAVLGTPVDLTYSTQNATTASICSAGGSCVNNLSTGTNQRFTANPGLSTTQYILTVGDSSGRTSSCYASILVTAATVNININSPSGASSYPQNSSVPVTFTTSQNVSAGEFGVWVKSIGNIQYNTTLVQPNGAASYGTNVSLASVPAGGGYNVVVAYRATKGTGIWSNYATSLGSFTIIGTVASPSCTFSSPSYSVAPGGSVNLGYSTTNSNSAQICSAGGTCKPTTVGTNQTFVATPTATTVYTMTVTNTAGAVATCYTGVSVSGSTSTSPPTTGSSTTTLPVTTTTTVPGGVSVIKTWEYCKDSRYTSTECATDMTLNTSIIPIFDPRALDYAHRLNAFFMDGTGVISEAAYSNLGAGTYEFWVYAATEGITQSRNLTVLNSSGVSIAAANKPIEGSTDALTYGKYKLQFTITATSSVRFKFSNIQAGRVFVDRISLIRI